jgi:hypothetical protein
MAINWDAALNRGQVPHDNKESTAVGNAVNIMCDRARPQMIADAKRIQAEKAAEARRQRQDALDAANVIDRFNRNGR